MYFGYSSKEGLKDANPTMNEKSLLLGYDYRDCASEILTYARENDLNVKVIFLNDGPGLLLGSMWNDYASIERLWPGKIKVVTLRMIPEQISIEWLHS